MIVFLISFIYHLKKPPKESFHRITAANQFLTFQQGIKYFPPLRLVWGTLNAYTSSYGKMETIQI